MTWSTLILAGVVGLILGMTINIKMASDENKED
jgi:hypothetical protein